MPEWHVEVFSCRSRQTIKRGILITQDFASFVRSASPLSRVELLCCSSLCLLCKLKTLAAKTAEWTHDDTTAELALSLKCLQMYQLKLDVAYVFLNGGDTFCI